MYSEDIKFTDYDGEEREERCYFHLTPAEMVRFQASYPGGMKKRLERAMSEKDGPMVMRIFEELIHMSYGVKSDDGRRFMKSEEIWLNFAETDAYNQLFMKLLTKEEAAKAFANAVLPDMSPYVKTEKPTV